MPSVAATLPFREPIPFAGKKFIGRELDSSSFEA